MFNTHNNKVQPTSDFDAAGELRLPIYSSSAAPLIRGPSSSLPCADNFFGKPEVSATVIRNRQTAGYCGVLALKVPPPPVYAPPTICNISKDGKYVVSGGKDVETYVWSVGSGDLAATLKGHEVRSIVDVTARMSALSAPRSPTHPSRSAGRPATTTASS